MDCKTDVCRCPGNMTPEDIPACVLADIAGRIDASQTPWHIQNNGKRAALAAYALHRFAEQTGLAQDGETTWTVITDFLADTRRTPEKDREALRRIVDGRIWDRLMTDTGMYTLMSQVQRNEWDRQLEGDSIPDISLDNVLATFRHLSENKAETFAKGLLDVFRRLSWDYKTNNPCRFGKKIVIDRLLVIWRTGHVSFNHEGAAKLNDLARPFYILDGKNVPDFRVAEGARFEEHYRANGFEGDQVWEGEYFSVRYYKKGSAHITFKRPELVDRINDIVAQACPGMLPPRV